jgi:hypothetical protein
VWVEAHPPLKCLRERYAGIPGFVEVKEGLGGLPTVVLTHACGASAEVRPEVLPLGSLLRCALHCCVVCLHVSLWFQ